jgi:hypothetical protein
MIKLKVNNLDKDNEEKNIVKVNLTPDIIMLKEALEYFDTNQYKLEELNNKLKYIEFIDSEKDFEHNEIILYDNDFSKLKKTKYEYIGTFDSSTLIWSWAWAIPTMKKKNTTIIRKILNYGVELEPTNNFLKTELITSRFRVTNKIQLDIYSAIVSYLSKKSSIIKIKIFNNTKIIGHKEGHKDEHKEGHKDEHKNKNNNVESNLIDVTEPYIYKDVKPENQYRYTEYYLFLLD